MPDTATGVMTPSRRPIEGPSAWTGADMRGREAEWSYCLSPSEIAEIEAALKLVQTRGLDIADIRREDFPLPTLGPVLDRLRAEVLDGRGFVLLRGVPVEDRPIAESAAAYWGIGSYFGSARSQNAKGHLLGHIYDLGGSSATDPNIRSYATVGTPELPYRSLRRRGAAVPAAREVGRAVGDRQFDGGAQRHGGAPARSAGAAVSAVPDRPARRSAGGQGAVLRGAGVQRARRHGLGAVFTPAYRLVAAVPRGAAADARGYRGARHAWRTGGRSGPAARHGLHAGRHPVPAQPHDPARPHRLRGLARGRAQAPPAAAVALAARGAGRCRRCSPNATGTSPSAIAAASSAREPGCTHRLCPAERPP